MPKSCEANKFFAQVECSSNKSECPPSIYLFRMAKITEPWKAGFASEVITLKRYCVWIGAGGGQSCMNAALVSSFEGFASH